MKYTLFIILMLTGCGGSDNSANNDSSKIFSLKNFNSLKLGVIYSSYLKTTDKDAPVFYGSLKIENELEKVIDGVLVTPQTFTFRKMNSLSGSGSLPNDGWDITYFFETATGNLISYTKKYYTSIDVLSCKSSSPYHMPSIIRSGDTDLTPSFNCGAQVMLDSGSWSALINGNMNITLTVQSKTINNLGEYKDASISYVLDENSNIISVVLEGLSSF